MLSVRSDPCWPPSGPVVYVLDLADRLISKAGPFAAAGIMVGSIYWTAVTYGAVTVMQVRPETLPQRIVRVRLHTGPSSSCLLLCVSRWSAIRRALM